MNNLKEILNKYCCLCCLNLFQKYLITNKISPKENEEEEENKEKKIENKNENNLENKNEILNNIIIKKFIKKWEKNFWIKFWIEHSNNLLKKQSAIKIQKIIRIYLSKIYYKRKLNQAINEMNNFWKLKREQKLLEKEKLRIAKETRAKVKKLKLNN